MNAKKSTQLRPQLEGLESMVLLSTVTAAAVHTPKPPVLVSSGPVVLTGTLHGTGHSTSLSAVALTGSGNLGKVGNVTFKLAIDLVYPPSSVTLNTRHGKLLLAVDGQQLASTGTTTYSIIGGTGSYTHATGSGLLTASYTQVKNHGVSFTIKFV